MENLENKENSHKKLLENLERELPDVVRMLSELRKDWRDEIPEDIVNFGKIKARKNWFASVVLSLEFILRAEKLSEGTNNEIQSFIDDYTSSEFKERLTEKEDIEKANNLIDKAFSELKYEK